MASSETLAPLPDSKVADTVKIDASHSPKEPPKQPPKPPKPQNPALKMLGLPRMRLPSRNWMIFLTVTGSFFGTVFYDRREKKKVQKKWCDLVAHMAQQPLPTNEMPRKLTIYLSAPPGDGLRPSRDYFREYVKPVLVAAAMDYDVIEGRKENEVRYGTAERIRRLRQKKGEHGVSQIEDDGKPKDGAEAVEMMRDAVGIKQEDSVKGDLILGRHTWKEYVRGLHEGWLGPLDEPKEPRPIPDIPDMAVMTGEHDFPASLLSDGMTPAPPGSAATEPSVEEIKNSGRCRPRKERNRKERGREAARKALPTTFLPPHSPVFLIASLTPHARALRTLERHPSTTHPRLSKDTTANIPLPEPPIPRRRHRSPNGCHRPRPLTTLPQPRGIRPCDIEFRRRQRGVESGRHIKQEERQRRCFTTEAKLSSPSQYITSASRRCHRNPGNLRTTVSPLL